MNAWDWLAVLAGTALLVYGLGDVAFHRPRRRRRPAPVTAPVVDLADDYPTTPIPRVPAAPPAPTGPPAVETRLMLRRDELLWAKSGDDDEGVITLGLMAAPEGQLGVLMDDNGIAIGVRLDRREVQALRDAVTCHLVDTARPVRP